MNIIDIINNEAEELLLEIVTTGDSIQTFEYYKETDGLYVVKVVVPEKNINTEFTVSFQPVGQTEERAVNLAFKERGGSYNAQTGFGVQFRTLATVTKIVKDAVTENNINIIQFQPVSSSGDRNGNRRMKLYLQYVKGGAGEDFDVFLFGGDHSASVEKRNPSFGIENGYVEPQQIQDIITQLTVYKGHYETDHLYERDPEFVKFGIRSNDTMIMQNSGGNKTTRSARRFIDWMLSEPDINYVQGYAEPERVDVPQRQRGQSQSQRDYQAPVQRITQPQQPEGEIGTFLHFLNTEVYGMPAYEILNPYFERIKDLDGFEELRNMANISISRANNTADLPRLQGIVEAIEKLRNSFSDYQQRHDVNETLNEIEANIKDLLS